MKCRLDLGGKWKKISQEFCDVLGYHQKELKKLTLAEIIHGKDQNEISGFFDDIGTENCLEWEAETELITKKGNSIPVHLNLTPIRDTEGKLGEVLCHIHNLSKQKELQLKWHASKQQFESLFNHNPLPVYYFDLEGNFQDANEKLAEFTGLSRDKLISMNFADFITGKDLERAKKQFQKAAEGEAGQYEIAVVVKDGVKRDIRVTKFPMYIGNEIEGVYGIFEDITNQKRIERNLQESEQLFKSLFTHNPYPVMRFDLKGKFMDANNKTVEMAGYSKEELLESGFSSFIAEEDLEEVTERFEKAASGEPQYYEVKGHTKNDVLHIESTLSPIYVTGEIIGLFCVAKDITQQKKAEQKLKESEERWQQLVEHNPQPVQIIKDGKIIFINKKGAEYYGASSPKELMGKDILDFSHPDNKENILARKKKLEQQQQVEPSEHKIITLNGKERFIEAHSIPIKYKGEDAIQTVIHDITDHKEKQFITGQSLKEKEILLQEIHHRVKNNLAVISGLLELQLMNLSDEQTKNALRDSQLRIQSMAMIHEKLYQSDSLHNIGFDTHLQELVHTINGAYQSSHTNVSTELTIDNITLELDRAIPCSLIVNEVLVNCYKHAFDKKSEGLITILLKSTDSHVLLEIADNGKGIPENFDISQQQSLGMTLIESLSRQLNGEMKFMNREKGSGTKFHLYFPETSSAS